MANPEHLAILDQGIEVWNKWREKHPCITPDLSDADLTWRKLGKANLSSTQFFRAKLTAADLREANLSNAVFNDASLWDTDLSGATFYRTIAQNAELVRTKLRGAKVQEVDFYEANLRKADFSEAEVKGALFENALLIKTNFESATLDGCYIHGASVWEVNLNKAIQRNLRMGPLTGPCITVDSLEVAQFIYLLLNNKKIRDVISNVTSKVVLILGRFSEERKRILDAVKEFLLVQDYVPVLFDFEPSANRDLTETIMILASLAKFVIADITDPKCIPQELSLIIPHLPSVPIKPILLESQKEYAMFEHWRQYPWVLPLFHYNDEQHLINNLDSQVIRPASEYRKSHADTRALQMEIEKTQEGAN